MTVYLDIKGTGEETQGNRIQEDDLDLHKALSKNLLNTLYHSLSPGKMISVEKMCATINLVIHCTGMRDGGMINLHLLY